MSAEASDDPQEFDEHLDSILQACEEGDEKWLDQLLDIAKFGHVIGLKYLGILLFLILHESFCSRGYGFILFCVFNRPTRW